MDTQHSGVMVASARSLGLWEEGSMSLSGDELDCTDPLQLTDRILHVS